MYLCAIILGCVCYLVSDKQHRMAFLETNESLKTKLTIQEQAAQQVSTVCLWSLRESSKPCVAIKGAPVAGVAFNVTHGFGLYCIGGTGSTMVFKIRPGPTSASGDPIFAPVLKQILVYSTIWY